MLKKFIPLRALVGVLRFEPDTAFLTPSAKSAKGLGNANGLFHVPSPNLPFYT
jgi:hypothetical protein